MREHVLALVERHLNGPFRRAGGANVLTKCPFHKGGEELKPAFSVNLETGLWHCFACQEAGNLYQLLEKLGEPASTINSELAVIKPYLDQQRELYKLEVQNQFVHQDPFKADFILPDSVLSIYDWCPLSLVEKGFDVNVLKQMEVGYDRFNQRITYPLRDAYGNLAGISGGATNPTQWPKYKVYEGGGVNPQGQKFVGDFGKWFDEQFPSYRCENHEFLWNYKAVAERLMSDPSATVYVVEGFKACMWMIQNGYTNTVALMGSYCAPRQQLLLHRLGAQSTILCLDNDPPGRRAARKVGEILWRPLYGRLKVLFYPEVDEQTQPDDYPKEQLAEMVARARTWNDFINHTRSSDKWH